MLYLRIQDHWHIFSWGRFSNIAVCWSSFDLIIINFFPHEIHLITVPLLTINCNLLFKFHWCQHDHDLPEPGKEYINVTIRLWDFSIVYLITLYFLYNLSFRIPKASLTIRSQETFCGANEQGFKKIKDFAAMCFCLYQTALSFTFEYTPLNVPDLTTKLQNNLNSGFSGICAWGQQETFYLRENYAPP